MSKAPVKATALADGDHLEPSAISLQPDRQMRGPVPARVRRATQTSLLDDDEADRRSLLLAELESGLCERGVQSVVGRRQRLALGMAAERGSGRTDPTLYVYPPDGVTVKVTVAGPVYLLDDGEQYPVDDPALAAAAICGRHASVIA